MLWRAFLVALVAALGLGLPLSGSLDSWMHTGQEWCNSRSTASVAPRPVRRTPAPTLTVERVVGPAESLVIANPTGRTEAESLTSPAGEALEIVPVAPAPAVVSWSVAFDDNLWAVADHAAAAMVGRVGAGSTAVKGAAEVVFGRLAKLPLTLASSIARRADEDRAFATLVDEAASTFAADPASVPAEPTPALLAAELPAAPVVASPSDEDRTFANLMDETVARFADDLSPVPAPVVQVIPVPAVEVVAPASPSEDDLTFAAVVDETVHTFTADLIAGSASELVEVAPPAPAVELANAPADPIADADEDARGRRLAEAMRLTNKAVTAWVDLLHAHTIVSLIP